MTGRSLIERIAQQGGLELPPDQAAFRGAGSRCSWVLSRIENPWVCRRLHRVVAPVLDLT